MFDSMTRVFYFYFFWAFEKETENMSVNINIPIEYLDALNRSWIWCILGVNNFQCSG